jgi:hypothetical protein
MKRKTLGASHRYHRNHADLKIRIIDSMNLIFERGADASDCGSFFKRLLQLEQLFGGLVVHVESLPGKEMATFRKTSAYLHAEGLVNAAKTMTMKKCRIS